MNPMMDPAAMRQAQEQMAGMSNEDLKAQIQNMSEAEKAQLRAMGMDPDQIQRAVSSDPNFAENARERMKDATPEQMASTMRQRSAMAQASAAQARAAAEAAEASEAAGGLPLGTKVAQRGPGMKGTGY